MAKKSRIQKFKKRYIYYGVIFLLFLILFVNRYPIMDYFYGKWYHIQNNLHPTQTFIPTKYDIIGVDISRYQKRFNWDRAKLLNQYNDTVEIQFIIAKATEGTAYIDPLFRYNQRMAASHPDIYFGAYHFFLPNKDVHQQANHFVNTIQLKAGNVVPVIDIEEKRGMSTNKIRERLKLFCNLLENKYGQKPIIYSNKDFMIKVLGEPFKDYPLWVAHYEIDDLEMPSDWNWEIWQITDEGSSFGTTHPIDVNAYQGGKRGFKKLLISD